MIGGITMGIGMALMEETHLDPRSGKFTNDNIAEYLVPTHADIPAIDAFFVDEHDPVSPLGAKGIGEIGITGVAAAVANAVYHATGRRVRDLPITPGQAPLSPRRVPGSDAQELPPMREPGGPGRDRGVHRLGEPVVLATVVRTRGSTYRRPGARLVFLDDGRRVGTISGGCLESDLARKARWLTRNGPALATYDTLDDDDDTADYRMGCRGVVEILLERIEPGAEPDDLRAIRRGIGRGEQSLIATVYHADEGTGLDAGDRLSVGEDGPDLDRLPAEAIEAIAEARVDGRSRSAVFDLDGGRVGLFLEVIRPPLRLVLFGSGPDAEPVARLARELGWSVTAVDRRSGRLSRIAADATFAGRIAEVAPRIGLDRSCRVVIMTHDFGDDRDALRAALASEAPYVGVLGPRHRTEALLDALADGGTEIPGTLSGRIHAPIGLDLGADAPEEIALAIVAEIQADLSGRPGGRLARPARDDPRPPRVGRIVAGRCDPGRLRGGRPVIGVILLAAGGSTRMGRPKQLLPFRGTTLLRHAVDVARAARLGPIVVVLGCEADSLREGLSGPDLHSVVNADWSLGMGGSIAAGLAGLDRAAPDASAAIVMLADQPLVGPELLQTLAREHGQGGCRLVACSYGDALGVPALFDRSLFDELRALSAEEGARGLIRRHRAEALAVPIGTGAFDVDTREDYARLISEEPDPAP